MTKGLKELLLLHLSNITHMSLPAVICSEDNALSAYAYAPFKITPACFVVVSAGYTCPQIL